MPDTAESAKKWNELATKFQSLADSAGGLQLRATANRMLGEKHDVVNWFVHDATSDTLRERFELWGAEASRAIGASLRETRLLDLWLHRLYQYLCDRSSPLKQPFISSETSEDGSTVSVESPAIGKVCEASTAFCVSLQHQEVEGEQTRNSLAQHFRVWIVENASAPECFYWSSPYSMRNWISSVARCARTSIPIDLLSDRLNVFRLPNLPSEFGSIRVFLDHIAREEGLMWCITKRGLWMAKQPPSTGEYIDANGREQWEGRDCGTPDADESHRPTLKGPIGAKSDLLQKVLTAPLGDSVSTAEAATVLGISTRTVSRWVSLRKLSEGPKRGTITVVSIRRKLKPRQ
jgi:hypothetical protein